MTSNVNNTPTPQCCDNMLPPVVKSYYVLEEKEGVAVSQLL